MPKITTWGLFAMMLSAGIPAANAGDFALRPGDLAQRYNVLVGAYGISSPIKLGGCTNSGCSYNLSADLSIGLMPATSGYTERALIFFDASAIGGEEAFLDSIYALALSLSDQVDVAEIRAAVLALFPKGVAPARNQATAGNLALSMEPMETKNGFLVTLTRL